MATCMKTQINHTSSRMIKKLIVPLQKEEEGRRKVEFCTTFAGAQTPPNSERTDSGGRLTPPKSALNDTGKVKKSKRRVQPSPTAQNSSSSMNMNDMRQVQ